MIYVTKISGAKEFNIDNLGKVYLLPDIPLLTRGLIFDLEYK